MQFYCDIGIFNFIFFIIISCSPFILIIFWMNEIPKIIKKNNDNNTK